MNKPELEQHPDGCWCLKCCPEPKMTKKEAERTAREYFKTTEQPDLCPYCRKQLIMNSNAISCEECSGKMLVEQPNSNAMIFEQVNGSIKVALELLERLEVKDTDQKTQKQGCIWTLKGWQNNNLKHLQKAFE